MIVGLGAQAAYHDPSEWIGVFVPAARGLLKGADIYATRAYVYPPFMAMAIVPFTEMPDLAARLVWYAINVVCIIGLVRSAWLLSGGSTGPTIGSGSSREWLVAAAGAACSAPYVLNALAHQQVDIIIAFLVAAGCLMHVRGRIISAAALIGLAAAFKGPPLLFALYFGVHRNWLAAALVFVVAIGVNLAPDLVIAPPGHQPRLFAWLERFVVPTCTGQLGMWQHSIFNQSLVGTLHRMLASTLQWNGSKLDYIPAVRDVPAFLIKLTAYGLMLLLLAVSFVAASRSGRSGYGAGGSLRESCDDLPSRIALELCVVSILMLLMSPMSDLAHLGPSILAAFCLARIAVARRDVTVAAIVALSAAGGLVVNKDLVGESMYTAVLWLGVATWSMLLLWGGSIVALARGYGALPARSLAALLPPLRVGAHPGATQAAPESVGL